MSTSLLQTSIKLDGTSSFSAGPSGGTQPQPEVWVPKFMRPECYSDETEEGWPWGQAFRTHFADGVDLGQNWQASILHQAFFASDPDRKGVVVELGAVDGIRGSNSYAFEQALGWHAVLIEGNPDMEARLKENRPGAEVYAPLVVTDTTGYVNFSICWDDPDISGLNGGVMGTCEREESVPSAPLSSVLEAHEKVDILFLDVEGHELTILQTIDFDKTQILVINVESGCPQSEVGEFLASKCFQYRGNIQQDSVWTWCGFDPNRKPCP